VPTFTVTPLERALLRLAAQAVIDEDGDDAPDAFRALGALSQRPEMAPPPATRPHDAWVLRDISADEGHLAPLAAAVAARRRVTFRYRTGETPADQTRRVEPWGVGYRNGAWYLAGYDVDRRDARVFRLGRIAGDIKAGRKSDAFAVPDGLDLVRFFEAPAWSFGPIQGPSVEARILLAAAAGEQVARLLPEDVPVRRLDDGRVVVRLFVRDAGALFDWLLPLAGDVEVLGPGDLRSQLAVRLETTAVSWSRG